MSNVIVGKEDCSVNALVNTILGSESISQVYEQWTVLARQLNLPEKFIKSISRKLNRDNLVDGDILPNLLHEWIAQESDKATLSTLITSFRNCNINSIADLLARKYVNPSSVLEASPIAVNSTTLQPISNIDPNTTTQDSDISQETVEEHSPFIKIRNDQRVNRGTFLQIVRRISTNNRKRNCGIFSKTKHSIKFISYICCQAFSNTFVFVGPLVLVMCFIYWVILDPILKTTDSNKFSKMPEYSTSTPAPFNGNITEITTVSPPYFENTTPVITTVKTKKIIPTWVPLNATVESWHELMKLMSHTSPNEEIDLTINFDNLFKWGDDLNLYNSQRIKSLWIRGHISLDNLAFIVKQMPLLQNLTLDNSENKLCARNKGQLFLVKSIPENSVHLPILQTLRLKDFSNCVEILESLVRSYDCKQLKRLTIEEHIDNHNIHHVQELIAKYNSVKILDLNFVNSSTQYFYKSDVIMDKVTKLYYNYNVSYTSARLSKMSLGLEFCHVFKNISHFKIGTGCIPYKEFENLLFCDTLKNVNITICISNNDILSDMHLRDKLVRLEYIVINLQFSDPLNCPSIAKVKRLGLNNVGKNVKEILTVSNCPIKRDKNGIEYKSDFKQIRV